MHMVKSRMNRPAVLALKALLEDPSMPREIDLEALEERKAIGDEGRREKSLLNGKKDAFDLYSYRKCFSGGN